MKKRVEQSKNISKFFDLRDLNNIIQNSKIQKFKKYGIYCGKFKVDWPIGTSKGYNEGNSLTVLRIADVLAYS